MSSTENISLTFVETFRSRVALPLAFIGVLAVGGCHDGDGSSAEVQSGKGRAGQILDDLSSKECAAALDEQIEATGTFNAFKTSECGDITTADEARAANAAGEEFEDREQDMSTKEKVILGGVLGAAVIAGTITIASAIAYIRDPNGGTPYDY